MRLAKRASPNSMACNTKYFSPAGLEIVHCVSTNSFHQKVVLDFGRTCNLKGKTMTNMQLYLAFAGKIRLSFAAAGGHFKHSKLIRRELVAGG
jgi:hypothetical protein